MRAAPAALLLASCSSSFGFAFEGMTGADSPAELASDLLLVPTKIDGAAGPLSAIDTGSPVVALNPSAMGVPADAAQLARFEAFGVTFTEVDFERVPPTLGVLGGIIGCTLLCDFAVALDYRGKTVTLDDAMLPGDLGPPHAAAFERSGGGLARVGTGPVIDIPPSRILVPVKIEDAEHTFLLDTGASIVFVRQSIGDGFATDGRRTLSVGFVSQLGTTVSTMFRLKALDVGGAHTEGVLAAASPTIDTILDNIELETGAQIAGVLGASFFREHHVIVDYPASEVVLRRYPGQDHLVPQIQAVGIELDLGDDDALMGPIPIARVAPMSDADGKGLLAGDRVTAIDGKTVVNMTGREAKDALVSFNGTSIQVALDCMEARCQSRPIKVDQPAF